jgi:hypothetical protein
MLPLIRYMFVTIVFLIIYITVVAPPLAAVTDRLSIANDPSGGVSTSVIGNLETVIFVGLPLILLAGIIIIGFIFAFGIRGTSVR